VADFPNSGDLLINSTLYPDGSVAAMEELIGNHGGLGGEQTNAFLFHPPDLRVPHTHNATDVYPILKARRGQRGLSWPRPPSMLVPVVDPWSTATLMDGLRRFPVWLARLTRVLRFDGSVFREIAADPYMTAPALLIALVANLSQALAAGNTAWFGFSQFLLWLLTVLAAWSAGQIIGGKGSLTTTLRCMCFAQAADIWLLLTLIPPIASIARFGAFVVTFLTIWVAASTALGLQRRRSIFLPAVVLIVAVIEIFMVRVLAAGVTFTFASLIHELGAIP
jgi:hypothetical protein